MSRRVWAGRTVVAALVAAGLALTGCTGSSGSAKPTSAAASELNDNDGTGVYQGVGLIPPLPRPNFTLTDTAGKTVSFAKATGGRPTLLYFGYTHCPDICPTTMADIGIALRQVPESVRSKVLVVFVTTDVKNDTASAIADWLGKFDSGLPNKFIGLRGTQEGIDAAQVAAHITLATGDGQQHSTRVLLYGSDDYARVAFLESDNETGQIAHDLQVVAKQK